MLFGLRWCMIIQQFFWVFWFFLFCIKKKNGLVKSEKKKIQIRYLFRISFLIMAANKCKTLFTMFCFIKFVMNRVQLNRKCVFFLFLINLRNMETQFGTSISEFRIFNINHLKLSFTRSTQKQQQSKRYITVRCT